VEISLLFVALLALLFTGIPIFVGLTLCGTAIVWWLGQGDVWVAATVMSGELHQYLLVAIPLFALMAYIMIRGKVVDDLYDSVYTLTRHFPGGLAVATIIACAIFAAISGSSIATALTIGTVAIPQMKRYGYPSHVAYGVVAAGGTLGILIPPSSPMILYAIVSDTSIGGLFIAGIIPGILAAAVLVVWSIFRCGKNTQRAERANWDEARRAIRQSAWALTLPTFVLGGMYLGIFTATEAAAAGTALALLITTMVYRTIGWRDLWASASDACRLTAMLFMILAGATVFSHALTDLRVPQKIVESLLAMDMSAIGFILVMMVLIVILGMFLESVAIILVTTPVILPAMQELDINPIWYGILLVINLEIAMITPPVGMNLFTIKAVTGDRLGPIIRGSLPYVFLLAVVLVIVLLFPSVALWLPQTAR